MEEPYDEEVLAFTIDGDALLIGESWIEYLSRYSSFKVPKSPNHLVLFHLAVVALFTPPTNTTVSSLVASSI